MKTYLTEITMLQTYFGDTLTKEGPRIEANSFIEAQQKLDKMHIINCKIIGLLFNATNTTILKFKEE